MVASTPWFRSVIEQMPAAAGLRVLMITCPDPDQVRAVARRAGRNGQVLVLEPDAGPARI